MKNKKIKKFIIYPFVITVRLYQIFLSPILKSNCRYIPTCSEYCIISLNEFGLIKGLYYSFKRILKCHPLGGYGYDPVPKKIKKEI